MNAVYELSVRKYYYFESIIIVAPTKQGEVSARSFDDKYIPASNVYIETVAIPAKIAVRTHCFRISDEDSSNGINKYLEENLNRYTDSSIWEVADAGVAKEYLDYVKRFYNVDLKPECKIMTTQFCTEVTPV